MVGELPVARALELLEQAYPSTEQHRHQGQGHLIDQTCVDGLSDDVAAIQVHVALPSGSAGPGEQLVDVTCDGPHRGGNRLEGAPCGDEHRGLAVPPVTRPRDEVVGCAAHEHGADLAEEGVEVEHGRVGRQVAGRGLVTLEPVDAVVGVGASAASLNFVARRHSAALCSDLVVGLRHRVFAVVARPDRVAWRAMVVGAPKKWVRALVAAAPPMAGLGLWSFLKSLLPFGLMVGTAIYLLALDPLLSALLVPLLVPYVAALAVVWAGVTRSRRRYLSISGVAMRPIIDAFGVVIKRDAKPRLLDEVVEALDRPAHREAVDLLFELRLVMQRVRMVNGVFSIAAVAAVLGFYIPLIDTTDRSWSDPLAYIVAMRLMLHNAQEVSSGLAMISRRVPEIDRLARFLAFEAPRSTEPSPATTTHDLALEGDA